ncbi:MAG: helix-turn-helix domain-containing protein [Thermodesulfobacteriota bacterium]
MTPDLHIELLSPSDVARTLALSERAVHKLVREGRLQCYQVTPRQRRFSPAQIEAFLDSRKTALPKPVDTSTARRLPSPRKPQQGREESQGETAAALRKEMRQWQ